MVINNYGMFQLADIIKLVTVIYTLILVLVLVINIARKQGRPFYLKIMYVIEVVLLAVSVALMV